MIEGLGLIGNYQNNSYSLASHNSALLLTQPYDVEVVFEQTQTAWWCLYLSMFWNYRQWSWDVSYPNKLWIRNMRCIIGLKWGINDVEKPSPDNEPGLDPGGVGPFIHLPIIIGYDRSPTTDDPAIKFMVTYKVTNVNTGRSKTTRTELTIDPDFFISQYQYGKTLFKILDRQQNLSRIDWTTQLPVTNKSVSYT